MATGGVAAAPVLRPAVMPEAFDGKGDWAEYLAYYNQCAAINQWTDAQKAGFLGVRLRDAAQRYYTTIPAARRQNWGHVVADMGLRFAPDANVRQYKAQFKARRRRANEPLVTLADDLRRLVARAYPTMADALQQELVRDQFVEALTPASLRVRLQENPPPTIQEAMEMALHLERIWLDAGVMEVNPGHAHMVQGDLLQPVMAITGQSWPGSQDQGSGAKPSSSLDRVADELAKLTARIDALLPTGQGGAREQTPARYTGRSENSQRKFQGWNSRGRGYRFNKERPQNQRHSRTEDQGQRQGGNPSGNQ